MKSKKIKLFNLISFITLLVSGCSNNTSTSTSFSTSNTVNNSSVITSSKVEYLTSEDKGTATIRIYKDNNSESKERYIAPKNVKMKYSYNDLSGVLLNNENVCPSKGDVNLLVIPVHLPGENKYNTEQVRNDIKETFFGNSYDSNSKLGFKSLKEFYYESSFGQLNFQGEVTNWFDVKEFTNVKTLSQITNGSNGTIVNEILQKAVVWAESVENIDLSKYDNNNDGSIDGVWLVYDHIDYKTEFEIESSLNPSFNGAGLDDVFWNFTGWDWNTIPDVDSPTTSAFSWSSFSMMYTSYCERTSNNVVVLDSLLNAPLDSHVYIHETGHLLGLDDYYASDNNKYHPMGKVTMMDQNVCDFDSYSKMLLGWVTPYIVYGTSEILIPTAASSKHGVIVIPTNYEEISELIEQSIIQGTIKDFEYEFNPFSEYIMIDLYSPDGLNEQDTYGPTIYSRDKGIDKTGVRIYHVDSRIFKCTIIDFIGGSQITYGDDCIWAGEVLEGNEAILMPISNQRIENASFQLPEEYDYYDQVRLLESSQINTFSNDGCADSSTLFTTKTKDFDISAFGYQFFNSNYQFNNGEEIPFKINVKTLKEID